MFLTYFFLNCFNDYQTSCTYIYSPFKSQLKILFGQIRTRLVVHLKTRRFIIDFTTFIYITDFTTRLRFIGQSIFIIFPTDKLFIVTSRSVKYSLKE